MMGILRNRIQRRFDEALQANTVINTDTFDCTLARYCSFDGTEVKIKIVIFFTSQLYWLQLHST